MIETEAELLTRLQANDKVAWADFLDLHSPHVYALALRLMKSEADAEDVLQETFANAYKAINAFEGRSKLGTWLYRIAYNAAMMRLRRPDAETVSIEDTMMAEDGRLIPKQLFDWCCLPEKEFETDEVTGKLEQAVRELPDKYKSVFILRELEGLSTRETAVALNLTEGAAKVRLHRARLHLREQLSPYFTDLAEQGGYNA